MIHRQVPISLRWEPLNAPIRPAVCQEAAEEVLDRMGTNQVTGFQLPVTAAFRSGFQPRDPFPLFARHFKLCGSTVTASKLEDPAEPQFNDLPVPNPS